MTKNEFSLASYYSTNPTSVAIILAVIIVCAALGAIFLRGSRNTKYQLEMILRSTLNIFLTGYALWCFYKVFDLAVLREDFDELSPVFGESVIPGIIGNLTRQSIMYGLLSLGFAAAGWWLQFRRAIEYRDNSLPTGTVAEQPVK